MKDWQIILLAMVGNTGVLAVLGFLAKSFVERLLTRDIERFKAELKQVTDEQQIRFSVLHQERAKVIVKLYRLLVQMSRAAVNFFSSEEDYDSPTKKTKYDNLWKKVILLHNYLDENRLCLPEFLFEQMKQLELIVVQDTVDYAIYVYDSPPMYFLEENKEAWKDIRQNFEDKVPKVKAALEKEFRKILGVDL